MNNRKVDNPKVDDEYLITALCSALHDVRIKLCHDYIGQRNTLTYLIWISNLFWITRDRIGTLNVHLILNPNTNLVWIGIVWDGWVFWMWHVYMLLTIPHRIYNNSAPFSLCDIHYDSFHSFDHTEHMPLCIWREFRWKIPFDNQFSVYMCVCVLCHLRHLNFLAVFQFESRTMR